MTISRTYRGGEYLDGGQRVAPGSVLDNTEPIALHATRDNTTLYDPQLVLTPDEITDSAGRFAAFCIEGLPVWGYIPVDKIKVADLGVGAGNFLVSLVDGLKQPSDQPIRIMAVDTDKAALEIARQNINNSLSNVPRPFAVTYANIDYATSLKGEYGVVYFNPPYLEKGHNITHNEASLAPSAALYSMSSTDEYERVVPTIKQHLGESGIAIIRLPRVDSKIDGWLSDYVQDETEANLLTVVITKSKRVGRFLLLSNGVLPRALSEYDYFMNYLGGKDRRERSKSNQAPIYHDGDCELVLTKS